MTETPLNSALKIRSYLGHLTEVTREYRAAVSAAAIAESAYKNALADAWKAAEGTGVERSNAAEVATKELLTAWKKAAADLKSADAARDSVRTHISGEQTIASILRDQLRTLHYQEG